MILGIYAVFMLLALILIALGYAYDAMILKTMGFAFIFIINASLLGGVGIQYQSGDIINQTSEHVAEVTIVYDTYNPQTIAYFFTILGFFGALLIAYDEYKLRRDLQE